MLVSLKWLSEYVPLAIPVKELANRLTLAGVKIEKIIAQGDDWQNVAVAEVLEVKAHPNADRLRLVTLDLNQPENPTVVCGASNVAPGQKIAFASVGARLLNGSTGEMSVLKAAKIRGVESAGMVCSEKELGLSEAHEGILVLPVDSPTGQPLGEVMGDTIFDVEITPNRPDLMSILGVAWEVAAQTHVKVKEPERVYNETGSSSASQRASVVIEDRDLCRRYLAGVVERVKVGPSPEWMQERLLAVGVRPINNVVDITNYVMLEMGQPLHAFDYRKLNGQKIIVRRAQPGEQIRTIDNNVRELTSDMLVIVDASKSIAVAGVMGGSDAEVTSATTTVLLEAATFAPTSVRRTSQALGLRSEASIRFEKGLHPDLAASAARRAMKLLVEITGGRAAKGLVDAYPAKRSDTRVVVTKQRIAQVLGLDLPTTQVRSALTDLGFGCRWVPPDRYVVRSPHWRMDVSMADDVVEELARVIGYDRLESQSLSGSIPAPIEEPERELREQLKTAAAAAGLQEVITYPLTTVETLLLVEPADKLEIHPPLRLENPMSSEQSVMRTSLRHSLLQTVAANLRRERGTIAIFECAGTFLSKPGELPDEKQLVVGAVGGFQRGRWGEPTQEPVDFFDAKGFLEEIFERTRVTVEFRPGQEFGMLQSRTAELNVSDARVGVIGQVHPQVAAAFEIESPVFLFEIDIAMLLQGVDTEISHSPPSRFPAVLQDIALLVDDAVSAAWVEELIASSSLVSSVQLFDVYEGTPLPAGKRSLAFAVDFQTADRTLTDEDVAEARQRIIRRLEHEVGAELRGA